MDINSLLSRMMIVYKVKKFKDLAEKLGVSSNTVDVWKRRGYIPEKNILKCINMTACNENWLLSGVGEMYKNKENQPLSTIETDINKPYMPYYDKFELSFIYKEKIILNEPKKIYEDNPLWTIVYTRFSKDIIFVSVKNEKGIIYKKVQDKDVLINEYLKSVEVDDDYSVGLDVIIRNDLFKKNHPLYEDKYLGVECRIKSAKSTIAYVKKNEDTEFVVELPYEDSIHFIELTRDELKKLDIVGCNIIYDELKSR